MNNLIILFLGLITAAMLVMVIFTYLTYQLVLSIKMTCKNKQQENCTDQNDTGSHSGICDILTELTKSNVLVWQKTMYTDTVTLYATDGDINYMIISSKYSDYASITHSKSEYRQMRDSFSSIEVDKSNKSFLELMKNILFQDLDKSSAAMTAELRNKVNELFSTKEKVDN